MYQPNYLVIHKKEWDRIKREEKSTNKFKEREEYFKSLTEKSQELIEKWSDSVQGHIKKIEKQKQINYSKAIQTIKEFNSRKKISNNKDVIKKAKELIFQDSCYGRQLLSALLESKTLEERDAQLKFQQELNETLKIQKRIEPIATSLQIGNNTELEENRRIVNKKQKDIETAQINKELYERKYKDNKEIRHKEKQQEMEIEHLIKQVLKNEMLLEAEILNREKEDVKKHQKQNDKIKKARAEAAQKEDLIREVWCRYYDKIKYREKTVFDKIHKDSCNTTRSQNTYKIVKQLNYEKDKKYNDFIESGIAQHMKRLNEQDQQDLETIERNKRKLLDKDNKLMFERKHQIDSNIDGNCCTDSFYHQVIPVNKEKTIAKNGVKPVNMARRNKLLENLKIREKATPAWNGLSDAHAQFANHASDILQQCRYKNMARKVINEYRRMNCIDEIKLPIQDY